MWLQGGREAAAMICGDSQGGHGGPQWFAMIRGGSR
jgi:hypothetical protein